MGWPSREVVSNLEYHSGSGIPRVSSGRRFVSGSVVVVAAMAAIIVATGAAVIAARATVVTTMIAGTGMMAGVVRFITCSTTVSGIEEIPVGGGIPVGPLRRGMNGLSDKAEMIDLGVALGVNLMLVAEGHKDLLADRDIALLGDQQVKKSAGTATIVGHGVVHYKRNGYVGG